MRLEITYREFWDVPRLFTVRFNDQTYLFDSKFDEERDKYPDAYKIYRLTGDGFKAQDWDKAVTDETPVGCVKVTDVRFDETRRKEMDSDILLQFTL